MIKQLQYRDLATQVANPNWLPFFVFDGNGADKDEEWIGMLRRGSDVSLKYVNLVLRLGKSLWSFHSRFHKGDQVIPVVQIQQEMGHQEMKNLVIETTKRVVKEPLFSHDLPSGHEGWYSMLLGTTNMVWKYLLDPLLKQPQWKEDEVEVARKYDLWLALSRFREGRLFELPMWCGQCEFVRYLYDDYYKKLITGNQFRIEDTLAPFTQHLRDLGMRDEDIVREYTEKMRAMRWNCHPEFFLAIADDPIFLEHRTSDYHSIVQQYLQGQLLGYSIKQDQKATIDKLVILGGHQCPNPFDFL